MTVQDRPRDPLAVRVERWLPEGERCLIAIPAQFTRTRMTANIAIRVLAVTTQSVVIFSCESIQPGSEMKILSRQPLGTRIQRATKFGRVDVGTHPIWVDRKHLHRVPEADAFSVGAGP